MKKITYFFLLALLSFSAFAQDESEESLPDNALSFFETGGGLDSLNSLGGKFGYTYLGGEHYLTLRITPELNFGKIGIGLDVPVSVNLESGKLRTEEFKNGVSALRMIRYLRYGQKKKDPVYIKVGDMTGSYLGYGLLLNNYSNAISFERRKFGLNFDVLVKKVVGIEGLYSDFNASSLNLLALRPYVRPFGGTGIPIVKTLEIGGSFITDQDKTSQADTEYSSNIFTANGGMQAFGADIGVTLIRSNFIHLSAYGQYANLNRSVTTADLDTYNTTVANEMTAYNELREEPLDETTLNTRIAANQYPTTVEEGSVNYAFDAGSGMSVGLNARMNLILKLLTVNARIERVWYNNNFMPQFFDATYEINKDARIMALATVGETQGIYGSLSASILNMIQVGGSLTLPDNVSEAAPAMVRLDARLLDVVDAISLSGVYYKGGLTDMEDAFKLDERSLASVRAGYKVNRFLTVGVDYMWTWMKTESGSFEASNAIMPYFGFNFDF
ncbi:hypothetical protein [Sediminitomix flava]|uniref:DUF5723 domain-containing protein n=1 Tax=Sediminitomix flava TaxID=379075 RepID=A0A315ZDE0_SEDFL|nr:hypothetical protein [Sediminitomix flava]PWJ42734.1 hypothetical protein BC781_102279 [Sediminitomix flava]